MKLITARRSFAFLAALGFTASLGLTGCDVDVEEGEMPTVDVDPGEMPDMDVAGPEIEYEEKTVKVPVGIDPADEGDAQAEDTD